MSQCNTENVPASGDPGNSRGLDDHESQAVAGTRHWAWPSLGAATLIVVVAGLFWRTVRYALAFPLWGDEAYVAVNLLTRDFAGLARPLSIFQIAPPGFLWAEWLAVHTLGQRANGPCGSFPYLAGVVSLLLFWRFCREVATRRTVLLAVGMLAASFYPVRHSTEVKPYAIDLLVSLVLLRQAGRSCETFGLTGRGWLCAVTIVGVWCSYAAVFPAVGVALFLGATHRSRAIDATGGSLGRVFSRSC